MFKTLPIRESLDFFKKKDQLKIKSKGKGSIYITPDLSKIEHEDLTYTNVKLTVIPAEISIPNISSRILQTKTVNGDIVSFIFNMIPDDLNSTENTFTGIILLTELEGKFIEAYRVKEGVYVSKFIKKESNGENKALDETIAYGCVEDYAAGIFCNQDLDEIIITAPSSSYTGPEYPNISPGYSWSYYNNQYYGYGTGYINYLRSLPCDNPVQIRDVNGQCVDDDFLFNMVKDSCANAIFTELENGIFKEHPLKAELEIRNDFENLNFSEAILDLFNHSQVYDYIVEDGTPQNPAANASTSPVPVYNDISHRYEITTVINTDYINQATNLSIARTIIHESVHAFFVYKYRSDYQGNIHNSLNQLYQENNKNSSIAHHQFYKEFIYGIAYSLFKWDERYGTGGNLGDYYYAMAWGGLTQYDIFEEIVKDEELRAQILKIIKDEMENNANARGTVCD